MEACGDSLIAILSVPNMSSSAGDGINLIHLELPFSEIVMDKWHSCIVSRGKEVFLENDSFNNF